MAELKLFFLVVLCILMLNFREADAEYFIATFGKMEEKFNDVNIQQSIDDDIILVCEDIKKSPVFVFESDGNKEDLSELQELEIQDNGLIPCEFRKDSYVYIVRKNKTEKEYFLYGIKKNDESLKLLAVAFPPLTLDQLEKSVFGIFDNTEAPSDMEKVQICISSFFRLEHHKLRDNSTFYLNISFLIDNYRCNAYENKELIFNYEFIQWYSKTNVILYVNNFNTLLGKFKRKILVRQTKL